MIVQLDLYRNASFPMQGVIGSSWGYGGACLTAQSAVFRPEAVAGMDIKSVFWRVCWKPNIMNGAQTAIRLISADSGPSNINQIASTFSGGKPNTPLNEAFDITSQFRDLVASHEAANAMFQLIMQSCGDGSNGALIYSSSIEIAC